jgi:hypothetical protein
MRLAISATSRVIAEFVFVHVADGFGDVVVIIGDGELRVVAAPSCEACPVFSWAACSLPRSNVSQKCLFCAGLIDDSSKHAPIDC